MMKNPMSRRAFFGVGASAAAVAAAARHYRMRTKSKREQVRRIDRKYIGCLVFGYA